MNRNIVSAVIAAAVVAALGASPAPAQLIQIASAAAAPAANIGGPIPLVNADEEMASFVKRAQEMIARKDYHSAIEILQALLNLSEQCFVPVGDGRRYVSLAANASGVIGKLPPEGMKLYRRLFDPEADELLRRAGDDPSDVHLRNIVRRYFHTRHGDDALNMLGAVLFDRGRFSQAARCWRDVLGSYRGTDMEPAGLLVKIAVAHHFAGEGGRAAEALKTLREKHADAECLLAGERQNAVAFAERMLSQPRPAVGAGVAVSTGWTSLTDSPTGVGVMAPCRPVLSPRWTRPAGSPRNNPNLKALVAASKNPNAIYRRVVNGRMVSGPMPGPEVKLLEGHVRFSYLIGTKKQTVTLPPTIHPVVAGTTVIVRMAQAVVAYDLLTGEKLWDTFDDFPLYRQARAVSGSRRIYNPGVMPQTGIEDEGRCSLSLGGGKVFAVGRFKPKVYVRYNNPRGRTVIDPDNSVLAAFSLTGQGKLVWRSDDRRQPEIMQGSKFVSAPTYVDGRLYALTEYMQTYYLLCLDADTGRMLWPKPAMVSQTPAETGRRGYPYNMDSSRERGSAPAVADGRVLVCTNAGVVAAFDAETGQGLWAYQYDSKINKMSSSRSYRPGKVVKTYPPNPVIAAQGRVLCLPSDGENVLALRADSGEPVWSRFIGRDGQRRLTAVDENRILLSAPGLMMFDAATGLELWPAGRTGLGISQVRGRPAVTNEAVLASMNGRAVILRLKDFSVTTLALSKDSTGMLGNLVSVDGKLLAANAAGVSSYFEFEYAHRELTQRLAKAKPSERAELLYQRGMNAFNDNQPAVALPDLQKAELVARQQKQDTVLARARQGLYQTHNALANAAKSNTIMLGELRKAGSFAFSERTRAEMLLRMAKYAARVGRSAEAAKHAHELTVKHGETDMVDVEIGVGANPYVRDDADTPRFSGYTLGHKFIAAMIAQRGQGCYGAFDAQAKAALDAAVTANLSDDIVAIARVYPHSTFAPLSLLRAGESLYRKALTAPKGQKEKLLGDAGKNLSRISREYPRSGLGPSAALGLAMVYEQMNPRIVWLGLQNVSGVPGSTRVSFAGVAGALRDVLRRFDRRLRTQRSTPQPLDVTIRPPLGRLYDVKGDGLVVRGGDGLPIRLGKQLFVLNGSKLTLVDATADTFAAGTRWEAPLPIDPNRMYKYGFSAWAMAMIGGLNGDKSAVVLACRGGFYGVDVRTGKILWRKTAGDSLVQRLNWMAVGDDKLVVLDSNGGISAIDIGSGKMVFQHSIPRTETPWRAAPQVRGGMLLAVHGRSKWVATLFDLGRRKALGRIKLGVNRGQAHLTADGLVVVNDGSSLRLIEPVLGMKQDIWKVALAGASRPAILGATDTHVIVSPSYQSGLLELRSLADYGRIERSFSARRIGGDTAVPVRARIVGGQLFVLAGRAIGTNRSAIQQGRLTYVRSPSLQAFDLKTGKLQWTANLALQGANFNLHVMPIEVCRGHISTIVKQSYNRPSDAMILDRRTGRLVQKIVIKGIQPQRGAKTTRHLRHYWLGSPTLADGRVLLETHDALRVYGGRKAEPKQ